MFKSVDRSLILREYRRNKMKKAIIIGAGPAGLTAAYELLTRTDIKPVLIEQDKQVGGLSQTINYKGNRIDIGGHRFFSKSEKVIDWWLQFLPLDSQVTDNHLHISYQNKVADYVIDKKGSGEKTMLVRPRKSRIYFDKKFFDYPIRLNVDTMRKLGLKKMFAIAVSYSRARLFPEKPEENLAQFFRNRFGKVLYETFFRDYTEKVWGIPCDKIPASWGSQRVKDLNISRLLLHAIKSAFKKNRSLNQEGTSTSLIEQFLYPKYGPGQMWEAVADEVVKLGGEIHLNTTLTSLTGEGSCLKSARSRNLLSGEEADHAADYFFSSMPVKELLQSMTGISIPPQAAAIANNLEYRDFLIVGILVSRLTVTENGEPLQDNWIYIQDKNVSAGRLQIFNNWSPYMVSEADKTWIGVEYFCNETDELWQKPDELLKQIAVGEMERIGILERAHVQDAVVVRVKKAYPSYHGAYAGFDAVKAFLSSVPNLFPIGRNGMHRYNNTDHSMLTAMAAVDLIIANEPSKEAIWEVNTGDEYHEEK